MKIFNYIVILLILFITFSVCGRNETYAANISDDKPVGLKSVDIKCLRCDHPRLIALDLDILKIRELIDKDLLAKKWHDHLYKDAVKMLGQPVAEHKLTGPRMLSESKSALMKIYTLLLMYRLHGEARFADRAKTELMAISSFKDWNPSHFLDVAEMAHAAAIGYDWLYDRLSPYEKTIVKNAIVELALKPAAELYKKRKSWVVQTHNWNQVCNGGMIIAALAVMDDSAEISTYIINEALGSVKPSLEKFGPDGGWDEGAGYWNYATFYNGCMLAALETAMGSDFGLLKVPGFSENYLFRLYFEGPIGLQFNFSDSGERPGAAPQLFWYAKHFNVRTAAWIEKAAVKNPHPLDLIWYDQTGSGPVELGLCENKVFKNINTAFLRTSWNDPNAIFAGLKGGNNKANHSHHDLGTFVLDAENVRWAMDLGSGDYNWPGYFGKQRFSYYLLRTEGHNTLVLNNGDQPEKAIAPIVDFSDVSAAPYAVLDLTKVYEQHVKKALRGIMILKKQYFIVRDEILSEKPFDVRWAMHTEAEVKCAGPEAVLEKSGKYMLLKIIEPSNAVFSVETLDSASFPKGKKIGPIKKISIHFSAGAGNTNIVVLFIPYKSNRSGDVNFISLPLEQWRNIK